VNDILKQRLVGALILIALGVVFWPIIFVQPESTTIHDMRIPAPPPVADTPVAPPDTAGLRESPPLLIDEQEAAEEPGFPPVESVDSPEPGPVAEPLPERAPPVAAPPAAGETRSEPPEQARLDDQGVPVAWMLQVVSVSSLEKAESLRQRLQDMGEKAWIKSVTVDGKLLHRVNVGPKFERARLEALRPRIDAEFGVQSLIKRYVP
jgi:DedD protein